PHQARRPGRAPGPARRTPAPIGLGPRLRAGPSDTAPGLPAGLGSGTPFASSHGIAHRIVLNTHSGGTLYGYPQSDVGGFAAGNGERPAARRGPVARRGGVADPPLAAWHSVHHLLGPQ